jgi:hypothetical protein
MSKYKNNNLDLLCKAAFLFEEREKTVGCGVLTGTNEIMYFMNLPWLSRVPLEVFSTATRPFTPLLKVSDVALYLGLTNNSLSMYLSRHKNDADSGIVQASTIVKNGSRKDLKIKGYFMTVRAIKRYIRRNM